jgi:regulator-associated protein of mTOR
MMIYSRLAADGIVRLYRNYDSSLDQGPVQMVSSFRGLNEVIQVRNGSGVILDWKQSGGSLLVGGDSRIIRAWDAHTETQTLVRFSKPPSPHLNLRLLKDLDTNSESPVTAITSDQRSSSIFVASFADGHVKVFDRRLEEEDAIVRTYTDHASWVQNVRCHPFRGEQFLSARSEFKLLHLLSRNPTNHMFLDSLDGTVKLWDLRGAGVAAKSWDVHPSGLSAFDVHSQTGVFAA